MFAFGALAIVSIFAGCSADAGGPSGDGPDPIGKGSDELYWGNGPSWSSNFINVCFESYNGDAGVPSAQTVAFMQRAIQNSWQKYSPLTFVGWGACTSGEYGIHVHIQDQSTEPANYNWKAHCAGTNPNDGWGWPCSTVGPTKSDGAHVNLTTTYAGQPTSFAGCIGSATATNHCLYQDVVHEFGHAIGFDHEQQRPDQTCPNTYSDTASGGGTYLSAYDPQSVMNYCAGFRNDDGNLTNMDIFGLQNKYGRKAPGSLVAFDGLCLDIAGGAPANGHGAQTWDCLGATQFSNANQNLYFNPFNGQIGLYSFPRVLDIAGSSTANGTTVWAWDPLNTPNQTWTFQDAELLGMGAMCADIPAYSTTNGTQVQLWPCGSSPNIPDSANWGDPSSLNVWLPPVSDNEKFTFDNTGHIRLTGPFYNGTKCLAVAGNARSNGTAIVINDCNNDPGQQFRLTAAGTIQAYSGTANLCIDQGIANLSTFDATPGKYKLQLWTCNSALNQKFTLFGQVRSMSTECLDVAGWGRGLASQIWSWACDPASQISTKQAFLLYW
jgi:hypothetical protein